MGMVKKYDSSGRLIHPEHDTIIEKIMIWLEEEKFSVERHDKETYSFSGVVKVGEEEFVNILLPEGKCDHIIIYADTINFSGLFVALPEEVTKKFLYDLRIALIHTHLLHKVHFDEENNLTGIQVRKLIYFDGLTKDRFFDIIYTILGAIELVCVKYLQFKDSLFQYSTRQYETNNIYK